MRQYNAPQVSWSQYNEYSYRAKSLRQKIKWNVNEVDWEPHTSCVHQHLRSFSWQNAYVKYRFCIQDYIWWMVKWEPERSASGSIDLIIRHVFHAICKHSNSISLYVCLSLYFFFLSPITMLAPNCVCSMYPVPATIPTASNPIQSATNTSQTNASCSTKTTIANHLSSITASWPKSRTRRWREWCKLNHNNK